MSAIETAKHNCALQQRIADTAITATAYLCTSANTDLPSFV
jgi:hypothetical protein